MQNFKKYFRINSFRIIFTCFSLKDYRPSTIQTKSHKDVLYSIVVQNVILLCSMTIKVAFSKLIFNV